MSDTKPTVINPLDFKVVQNNFLVRARSNHTITEKKILCLIVSRVKPDDIAFQEYEFKVKDVLDIIGLGEYNHNYLRKITKALVEKVHEVDLKDGSLLQVASIASAKYSEDRLNIKFTFHPDVKVFYLELKEYTIYRLGYIMSMDSMYSIRLYEIANSFLSMTYRRFSVEELRHILDIESNQYKLYTAFRIKILYTAQLEMAEKTDLYFLFKEEKRGNKIAYINFTFLKILDEDFRKKTVRYIKFHQLTDKAKTEISESIGVNYLDEPESIKDMGNVIDNKAKLIDEAVRLGYIIE